MNVLTELKSRFHDSLCQLVDDPTNLLAMIRPAQDAKFGDYQANCAMPLKNKLGKPSREIAEQIIASLDVDDLCDAPEVAGPGFINLRLRDDWLVQQIEHIRHDERLGVDRVPNPKTYIVDFSSPNVAKPMHVGHIRSTVIGDALCRILRFAGHTAISDNHLGDWGTQFGMIIYGYRNFVDSASYEASPVQELGRIYRVVRQAMDALDAKDQIPRLSDDLATQQKALDELRSKTPGKNAPGKVIPEASTDSDTDKSALKKHNKEVRKAEAAFSEATKRLETLKAKVAAIDGDSELSQRLVDHADIRNAVLEETVKLHEGDPANRGLWEEFLPKCREDIQRIYDRLSVSFDYELGESFYHDRLVDVVSSLQSEGLATESEGATCVFLEGFETPMIVRKRDGAFLYATTDLATVRYRMETWDPDAILYVVDFRQGEHFEKFFAASRKMGYSDVELKHVSFGTVLGNDGKPFATRSGDLIGLDGLLDEAESRALKVVTASDNKKPNGPELSQQQREHIARVVGIAALKYADLSQNRESDYVFNYDKMLALTGNTATYLQYSYARVFGIFKRAGADMDALRSSTAKIVLSEPAERVLAKQLLSFSEAIDDTLADYRPNLLTNYVYDLARAFTSFFEKCPVIKAENTDLRDSRLLLCDLTARTLRQSLLLLGIDVVEKM